MNVIYKWMPGLKLLINYRKEWLSQDLAAGLSVALIALPIGLALAGLVGLPPEVGLYSTIFPMTVFALFATSKLLIIGPDAPTCMIVASVLLPYVASGKEAYYEVCLLLTVIVGVISILAGIFRFGFISDFLSKPLLIGYLNGLMFTIIISQIDKVFGYSIVSSGFLRMLIDFISKLSQTNSITLAIGLISISFLVISQKFFPRIPSTFIITAAGGLAVYLFGLRDLGVETIGYFPAGIPTFGIPNLNMELILNLIPGALSIVLISYCSAMLSAKSFAVRNKYEVESNQEFIALGAANIFSGVFGGFAASGADSLTAVAESTGAKTPLTSIIATMTLISMVFFLASLIAYLPFVTLSSIVIVSVLDLLNIPYLRRIYKIRKLEFFISIVTTICVMSIGVMNAIYIAVGIAILNLIVRSSKPSWEVQGRIEMSNDYANVSEYEDAKPIPGILIFKFNSALVFYNAEYFRNALRDLIGKQGKIVKWVLVDASAINYVDTTATDLLWEYCEELKSAKIVLAFSNVQKEVALTLEKAGLIELIGRGNFFVNVESGVKSLEEKIQQM